MLGKPQSKQIQMEFVTLEELVPKDHLLRKIESAIDFEFIRERVRDLYCADNGRPSIDPVILFKIIFIGYLYGVRSERQLMRDIQVNTAYRWFLGIGLQDKVPDASTLSQNRRRRFIGSGIYQQIFDEIVMQAAKRDMVGGRKLYTDSTHLKANANKRRFMKYKVKKSTKKYLKALEEDVQEDREDHGKKPLKPGGSGPGEKEVKVSTTDPDSGYMVREGKPEGFFYLDHRTVDGVFGIITDSFVTPGNVNDAVVYLERLDRQRERFDFDVDAVGLDAGYFTASICRGLEDREIYGVIGYRRPNHKKGYFRKRDFVYDPRLDCYICPAGQALKYSTTGREGYRYYKSDPARCADCQHLNQCTRSANKTKVVTRHVWQDSKERIDANRLTPEGKKIYRRRRETVERSFADAKQLHGHRYARMRGIEKVTEQCLLAAACQNMKKIALRLFSCALRAMPSPEPFINALIRFLTDLFFPSHDFQPDFA